MIHTNKARSKNARILLGSIAALSLSGLWAPSAFAAAYTIVPDTGGAALDWNTALNWSPATGTPGGGVTTDIATVSGDFNGSAQTVNISTTLVTPLSTLTLGDTNATPQATTIGSSGGSLALSGATITSAGPVGAVNTISAPISLTGSLTVGNAVAANNGLAITGKITPVGAVASHSIENSSMKTVSLGDIDISAGSTASVVLTIRSGTTAASTVGSNLVLNGTIADGATAAGALILGARSGNATIGTSSIQINANNTYTGLTTLGIQANVATVYKINSTQPFGAANTSSLTIGAGAAQNILEAISTDRTISKNSVLINRPIGFQGTNSVTLAATKIDVSNNPGTGLSFFTNDIITPGKTVTLGLAGSAMNLNAANITDLYRVKDVAGAGTTIIASNIADNSGVVPTASRMGLFMKGTGSLILTGANTFQGGLRITGTGTVQLGNGLNTGSFVPSNSITPVVNGTAAGTLAFNRSDAVSSAITANGPITLAQKGAGALTLTNSQFHSGATTVGDGTTASKLVVTGSVVGVTSTGVNNATVATTVNSALTYNTVTLGVGDTTSSLNLKVGQPVYVTGNVNSLAYVDSIISSSQFTVFGGTLLTAGSAALSFGEGSALGTSAAITTVNNHSTLGGTGAISGAVNGLAGSHLAPGINTVDGDVSGRFNFGAAGTLSTGALTLTGADLDFDLAATAAGLSDSLLTGASAVSFSSLNFTFNALTAGVLETGVAYNLITGSGVFTGDATLISTSFNTDLVGLYTPTYSVNPSGLQVTFSAVPEPATFGLLAGMAALGGCLSRRRRQSRA